jgi:DNA-directed RNA polymerase delta subunit
VDQNAEIIAKAISGSLKIIEQGREREIISRRFGLSESKETLEQIGDMLSITRERVRQLEKAILVRLRILAEDGNIKDLAHAEKIIIRNLTEMGRIARISDLAEKIFGSKVTEKQRQSLAFIGEISASLTVIEESEKYFSAIGIADYGNEKEIKSKVDEIVTLIKKNKAPISLDELDNNLNYEHPSHIKAIASISKLLATLNDLWGLAKWPTVNPKNIRDKIYVVLEEKKEPMHFEQIANAIKGSDFRRKNVTLQAIHNELIKDSRFVLIGRGIYALDTWGYKKGTVSETISDVLRQAKKPLSREQIVKRVLALRKVKETTILLNLQNKKLFKKIDKNSYTIAE